MSANLLSTLDIRTTNRNSSTSSLPGQSFLGRIWRALHEVGRRRAVAQLALHVRLHGGRPTGNIEKDAHQIAALRGLGRF